MARKRTLVRSLSLARAVAAGLGAAVAGVSTPYAAIIDEASGRLAPYVTFTRSSTATYFDATGVMRTAAANEPRYDHDPVTGALRGLLVEEQRTNLLLRSQEFDNAVVWILSGADRISNAIVAPDGTLTAEKLVETAVDAPHGVTQNVSLVSGTTYAFSFYAKAAERTVVSFFGAGGLSSIAGRVNLTTGAVESGTVSVQNVGNGWWRISAVGASTFTGANSVSIQLYNVGGTYLGDGTSGVFLWGAQLEAGSFATSYIPTTSATVTRASELPVVSSLASIGYNSAEGTIFAEYVSPPGQAATFNPTIFSLNDGTGGNRCQARYETSGSLSGGVILAGGISQASLGPLGALVPLARVKLATAIKANDFAAVTGGGAPVTDAAGSVPAVTRLEIATFLGAQCLNGWLRRLRYYPRRLPNATLPAITA